MAIQVNIRLLTRATFRKEKEDCVVGKINSGGRGTMKKKKKMGVVGILKISRDVFFVYIVIMRI